MRSELVQVIVDASIGGASRLPPLEPAPANAIPACFRSNGQLFAPLSALAVIGPRPGWGWDGCIQRLTDFSRFGWLTLAHSALRPANFSVSPSIHALLSGVNVKVLRLHRNSCTAQPSHFITCDYTKVLS